MANYFIGDGNLADTPKLTTIEADGEERVVANMRIHINRRRKNAQGEYEDRGGFWLNASCWNQKAREAARLLRKGALIRVEGELEERRWLDEEENERSGLVLNIREWALLPYRIESVSWRSRNDGDDAE
jgi:single-strand DNA-binding protein